MRFGRRRNEASRPWRLSAKLLIASSVVTIIGFSAICASVLLDMRRGEEALARQTLENLASGIDADIGRNVELYDLSLRAVASSMVMPEVKDLSKPIRHLILFDHAATAKHFGAIQVFDADGQLTVDASTLDPVPENRADEEFFKVHRDRPDTGLFISRPMLHRGSYAIVLSRRITGADGRFLGVVAGSIRFSYFHEMFGRLNLGLADTITVVRRDGTVIMRVPFDLDVIGKNIGDVAGVKRALSEPSGWYSGQSVIDGMSRLYVWRDGTKPLVVLVGKPWSSILNLWRKEAIRIGAIMMALVLFMLAVTLFLAREISRRAQAEDKLEELATTDALTGLKNRRKFDATMDDEWRRATRQQTPLALLMIDADHFKAYNDTFGHQAGDQVLIGIAICISDSVRRAGDCAARYGGEEFAVLLPGLSSPEALVVAEKIRLKVQQWSDESEINTVSIGIASLTPGATIDWSELVGAADKALYAAKANGRNQSVLASIPKLSLVA
ncbi:sensor domain-containing diguanylate cyclase [Bradyrhizobium canariense]|uniref:diguanylate cyclase n=1 Tax=Bradyrhizobium canariense TaxID=255045 RepID=A0A1H2A7Q3_9BRAD|nr:diguanylate cyclase [Bradyrhizobium canariense]SDT41506.1 diguanylate cyclase (GGDEF) domain-containing protein [Bradyrhizobium canariense]